MQILPSERPLPMPLICSGCRHWGAITAQNETAAVGRCGRFNETRPGAARPRCNICWEPAAVARVAEGQLLTDQ
ncbi:MAG: hypothetical protein LC793_09455 [Thermomicrobia bacterium]|nr:hypothetical protein [Thermomicrobia bacterium]MCA1724181.1 hypothetical protein [Thermomicrobia bacterium]